MILHQNGNQKGMLCIASLPKNLAVLTCTKQWWNIIKKNVCSQTTHNMFTSLLISSYYNFEMNENDNADQIHLVCCMMSKNENVK